MVSHGFYRFPMDSVGLLWISYGFRWVPMDSDGLLLYSYGFLWVLTRSYRFQRRRWERQRRASGIPTDAAGSLGSPPLDPGIPESYESPLLDPWAPVLESLCPYSLGPISGYPLLDHVCCPGGKYIGGGDTPSSTTVGGKMFAPLCRGSQHTYPSLPPHPRP